MPVRINKDKDGCYAVWGVEGKHYYFPCGDKQKQKEAEKKAFEQGKAIIASQSLNKALSVVSGQQLASHKVPS